MMVVVELRSSNRIMAYMSGEREKEPDVVKTLLTASSFDPLIMYLKDIR